MAESKFAGIFQNSTAEELYTPERLEKHAAQVKALGRPPGKRSHPDYKQYSILLKKHTHRQVTNILRDRENGQDLSELVQQLLEQWVKKQQND
jgi:hypothetical protein